MARSRGSRAPYRGRSTGIARDWSFGPGTGGITSLIAPGSAILGAGVSATASEITVMRTRGICTTAIKNVGAADADGMTGAVGIGKCTLAAFTAGIGSVPTPLTEVGWDGWLWHSFFAVFDNDVSRAPSDLIFQCFAIDSKAMRKIDSDEVIYAAVEVGTEIGTVTLDVHLDTRILFQDSGS